MSGSSAGASLEPVRRFEVFTGEGRRRKWALADTMAIVAPAPVAVAEALPPPARGRRTRRSRGTATAIELEVDGVSVKIARDADAKIIAAVIEALKMAR